MNSLISDPTAVFIYLAPVGVLMELTFYIFGI